VKSQARYRCERWASVHCPSDHRIIDEAISKQLESNKSRSCQEIGDPVKLQMAGCGRCIRDSHRVESLSADNVTVGLHCMRAETIIDTVQPKAEVEFNGLHSLHIRHTIAGRLSVAPGRTKGRQKYLSRS
jgi:hypothetical protein